VSYLGLDIGGTELKAGLVDADGRILRSEHRSAQAGDLAGLIDTIGELLVSVSDDAAPVALGVGVPGLISADRDEVDFAPNVTILNGAPMHALLVEKTGLPVVVRNDADLNAWGEFKAGAGQGTSHMMCLTVGTGLGSGLIVNGSLYSGTSGYGAEAGHIIVDRDGRACGCGGRGCLETVVSATGIVATAREGVDSGKATSLRAVLAEAGGPLTAKMVLDAAVTGDQFAASVYTSVGRFLGIACGSLINLLNLEMIVIGGGVSAAGKYLLDPAIEEARSRTYSHTYDSCRIVSGQIGPDAGIVGAALYAAQLNP
jgi:glucokinase